MTAPTSSTGLKPIWKWLFYIITLAFLVKIYLFVTTGRVLWVFMVNSWFLWLTAALGAIVLIIFYLVVFKNRWNLRVFVWSLVVMAAVILTIGLATHSLVFGNPLANLTSEENSAGQSQ